MPQTKQKLIIYTPQNAHTQENREEYFKPEMPETIRKRISPGERLLRNTAVACAMLFAVLSLRNIDQPWAQAASTAVEKALTVDFDVDETLGELHFVQRFLPESALVFWNITETDRMVRPVAGGILHDYSDLQPWYTFVADNGDEVCAGKSGMLTSAIQTRQGDWTLEIQHSDGTSAVYAYVDRGAIEVGESVAANELVTTAALQGCVYLEYRRDGKPVAVKEFLS